MNDHPYAKGFEDLVVYAKARSLALSVFEVSRRFPKFETYSLTDQLLRSSGAVGAQIAEAWGKRRYSKHFVSKLTDADSEQMETQHWMLRAHDRGYLPDAELQTLRQACQEIGRMLGTMIQRANSFCQ
jgi:four helix bundle protein